LEESTGSFFREEDLFYPEKMEATIPLKCRYLSTKLHGVT
jgi:hypothetical protein